MNVVPGGLALEAEDQKSNISTDNQIYSVGELVALYREGELSFDEDMLKRHTWAAFKVTRLVESILLGLPLPAILVHQKEDGHLSAIGKAGFLSELFLYMGLGAPKGLGGMPLVSAKYLPSLEGKVWQGPKEGDGNALSFQERISIKRTRVQVNVILDRQNKIDEELLFFWK